MESFSGCSGKTNLWLNFIKKRKCFYHKQFHKIYIFSNSLHTIKEKINLPKQQLIHGFDLERLSEIISEETKEAEDDESRAVASGQAGSESAAFSPRVCAVRRARVEAFPFLVSVHSTPSSRPLSASLR